MNVVDILLVVLGVLVALAIVVLIAIYVGWVGVRKDWRKGGE